MKTLIARWDDIEDSLSPAKKQHFWRAANKSFVQKEGSGNSASSKCLSCKKVLRGSVSIQRWSNHFATKGACFVDEDTRKFFESAEKFYVLAAKQEKLSKKPVQAVRGSPRKKKTPVYLQI